MMRLTLCLFVLWIGVTVGTVVDLQKRIIGGQTCGPHERHYHVRLRLVDAKGNSDMCGGSLISDQWILTAAHCKETMYADIGVHPGPTQQVQKTTQTEIFKDQGNKEHDIMLLKLPTPINIQPVRLPDCQKRPKIDDTVQIAGHGGKTRAKDKSDTLQCADLKVVECDRLEKILAKGYSHYYEEKRYQHWFCGQNKTVVTCPGDSGGGVVFNNMIYGVHSFTGEPNFAVSSAPVGFMDVCAYIKWIHDTTGI
uniref:Peptidase S1 domain-containing protein n=1 Tax=Monopterus albus TaxID=43700 RepID=A0A3Q3K068_MONAL